MKQIPETVTVGGVRIVVSHPQFIEDGALGKECIAEGWIKIADEFGERRTQQCPDSKRNTFFHELTHAILDTMGEFDLSNDEKFVNTFAGYLTEAMVSAKVSFEE